MEAEYVAMCHTTREILWINGLLKEICVGLTSSPQRVFVDQGAIFIAKNHVTPERSKLIDIKYFFLRDLLKKKQELVFEHVPSNKILADILTKRVPKGPY